MRKPILAATVLMMVLPLASWGQTTLKATFGWGDAFRVGRWTPIYVDLADAQVRSVILHVHGQYGFGAGLDIWQRVAAERMPTLFCLMYPVNAQASRISVIATDEASGKTLASQLLQNPADFSPAGRTQTRVLASDEKFIGVSGEISDSLKIHEQLDQAAVNNGVVRADHLPAWAMGFEGVNVLILAAPDLHELDDAQQRAIVDWINAGGNLLFIPGIDDLPGSSVLLQDLPCDIANNASVMRPSTEATLNARVLSPHGDAQAMQVGEWTAYTAQRGLGRITVLPVDVSPLKFESPQESIAFWRSVLAGLTTVPDLRVTTEMPISNEQDASPPQGAKASESVGRGVEETHAIGGLLAMMNAGGAHGAGISASFLLMLAGLCFVLGPMDSVLLMRLGQAPRHWLTVAGWLGFFVALGGYGMAKMSGSTADVRTFGLIDQVGQSIVAQVDLAAVESSRDQRITPEFPEDEWWEPANQAAEGFSPDRFFDVECHEDQNGCRPMALQLSAGEVQTFRGESLAPGAAMLGPELAIHHSKITGKLTNHSPWETTDVTITAAGGACRLGAAIAPGATVDVDQDLATDLPPMGNLPADFDQISPDRARRISSLVQSGGWACIMCQMSSSPGPKLVVDARARSHWEVLRAVTQVETK